ncbi:fibronectin type III domain-containing protein [Prosthecobacter sp.]|uniref:fibronectin type III domain-containing protein n=1 Tax=Prosthecobacter sp. TaxID=1965333 RepID=UPI0037831063
MRIAGVQIMSKGDSTGIAAAGLATQKTPTPVGLLSPPSSLTVTLGQNAGSMELTWGAVKKNRSYLLQYAEGKRGDPNPAWTTLIASKPKYVFTDMIPGTSYLFRVATIGGKGGQSSWSPTVVRVAG